MGIRFPLGLRNKFARQSHPIQNVPDFADPNFKALSDRVIEDLKSHPKIVGISLQGSLASGEQDEFSDINLDILVWRNWEDLEQVRKDFEKMVRVSPKPEPDTRKKRGYALSFDWGIRIIRKYIFDFNFEPVETYTAPEIERILSCERLGTTGIRDIVEGQVLYDPKNFFAEFKRKLQDYPMKLSRRIAQERLWCLRKDYFMIKTSIGRRDRYSTALSTTQFSEDAGHLLFALNREWHPGTKRLARSLAKLKILPPDYPSLVEKALNPTTARSWDELEGILDRLHFDICSLCESG